MQTHIIIVVVIADVVVMDGRIDVRSRSGIRSNGCVFFHLDGFSPAKHFYGIYLCSVKLCRRCYLLLGS